MSVIPDHSRAAVLRAFGEPLALEDVPIPAGIEPGAILVKTEACSICGTDVHLWQGSLALKVDLPVILGHEMVGRIVKMGPGTERDSVGRALREGDRICWTHTACGECYFCTVAHQPTLCDNRRAYMFETMAKAPYLLGGFTEYGYVLPESGRIKVPDNVPNDLASLSSCAFRSVMNAFDNLGDLSPADSVCIQGAGPLGLLAAAVSAVSGAKKIIVVGAPDARLDLATAFGATDTISIERAEPAERLERVRELTNGRGADVVMEFTGHPAAFGEGLDLVRKGGRYLIVGQLGEGSATVKPSTIVKKNIQVIGSFSGAAKDYYKALDFVSRHHDTIPFGRMITGRYRLDEVNTALDRMKRLEEIKPLIELA